jgi:hypothetical protein
MEASSKRFVRERGLSHNRGAKALLSVKPEDILLFWALFRKVSNRARGVGAFFRRPVCSEPIRFVRAGRSSIYAKAGLRTRQTTSLEQFRQEIPNWIFLRRSIVTRVDRTGRSGFAHPSRTPNIDNIVQAAAGIWRNPWERNADKTGQRISSRKNPGRLCRKKSQK